MDDKSNMILTVVTVIITALLMTGIAIVVISFSNGIIDEKGMLVLTSVLSTTLMTLVVIYGALTLSKSKKEQYMEFLEEKEKE